MAPKKRRLGDLYVVGKEVTLNDNTGDEPITVWLQKLNPVQSETALRKASAARAKYLAARKQPESEEYREAMSDVMDYTHRPTLIEVVARDQLYSRRIAVEAEQGSEEEWSKDDYLQSLFDAWTGTPEEPGLRERYAADPNDEEAKRVFEELQRYNSQVDRIMEGERATILADYESWDDDKLMEKAVERIIENRSLTVFMHEHETQQLYFATREPDDHKKLYFEDIEEARVLPQQVRTTLTENLRLLNVERDEGKGLAGILGSSPSSEQSETAGTEVSSGLVSASP